jgi:hypothetical protein
MQQQAGTRKAAAVLLALCASIAGCASVRQADLDAWRDAPVAALDSHAVFATLPVNRTVFPNGVEVRNYVNTGGATSCPTAPLAGGFQTARCTGTQAPCNNLFYIKEGRVLSYAPVGECVTDERLRPQQAVKPAQP